jgi:RecB family exonuclease
LRRRASLLDGDRLDRHGALPAPTPTSLLVDERRLFYVAVTRARRRLVVTAVRSALDDGDRPSRFLAELGLGVPERIERPTRLLSLSSLAGRLRRAVVAPESSEPLRVAAAASLARLAAAGPDGLPLVPAAHPDHWWGVRTSSPGARPVRPDDQPVALSASAVAAYEQCPLKWFLEREARAAEASTTASGFGLVVHALANMVATGSVPAELSALEERLDQVWSSLGFDARWQSDRERREAVTVLQRFLTWHDADARSRAWVASELGFQVPYEDTLLRGSFDRVETDEEGRAVVVDFKTSKSAPNKTELAGHAQLGVYQVAVRAGALREVLGGDIALGGAELVQLRLAEGAKAQDRPKVAGQKPLDDPQVLAAQGDWADELVLRTRDGVRDESFPARVNSRCSTCSFAGSCPAQDAGAQVVR